MIKKIVIAIAALWPALLCAQPLQVPDDEVIFRETFRQESPFYYPHLLARYVAGDRTLTQEDYHYLYYGYVFQTTYRPLEPDSSTAYILTVLDRTPEPDAEGCRRIIDCARDGMARDPFNLTNLNLMAYAQTILGDTASARTNAIRVEKILQTIKSSGRGTTERSPWVITSFAHAEALVASLGEQVANRRVVSRTVEYLDIGRRNERVKGFFFDYERIYRNKPEYIPAPAPRGFQINGIKVK